MDIEDIRHYLDQIQELAGCYVQKIPGSAIALRYIKSSYQNDPVRSAVELFLFLFAVRYLLAPSYSVPKHKGYVDLADDVRDFARARRRAMLNYCLGSGRPGRRLDSGATGVRLYVLRRGGIGEARCHRWVGCRLQASHGVTLTCSSRTARRAPDLDFPTGAR